MCIRDSNVLQELSREFQKKGLGDYTKNDTNIFEKVTSEERLHTCLLYTSSETIDHKEYETKMQKLLDNYVVAKEMRRITEPVDITDAENFDQELEKMGTDRGKADSIRTRLTLSLIHIFIIN